MATVYEVTWVGILWEGMNFWNTKENYAQREKVVMAVQLPWSEVDEGNGRGVNN